MTAHLVTQRRLKFFGYVARSDILEEHAIALRSCMNHVPKDWRRLPKYAAPASTKFHKNVEIPWKRAILHCNTVGMGQDGDNFMRMGCGWMFIRVNLYSAAWLKILQSMENCHRSIYSTLVNAPSCHHTNSIKALKELINSYILPTHSIQFKTLWRQQIEPQYINGHLLVGCGVTKPEWIWATNYKNLIHTFSTLKN